MRRVVGAAAGATLALALLVCGCVFTAMAGPALSLHTRSQALQQTLTRLPATTKTVQVSAPWNDFVQSLSLPAQNLDDHMLAASTSEIARGLAAVPLPLAGGDWASLNSASMEIASGAAASAQAGLPPKLAVFYRHPFASHVRLVAGSYAVGRVPAGAVAVAATTQTAVRFGLHPGSRLTVRTQGGQVTVVVTAIVAERDAGSTFWTEFSAAGRPGLEGPPTGRQWWEGGVIADPGQLAAMQDAFGGPAMELWWEFPLAVGGVNADQAQGLADALNRAATLTPSLSGSLAPATSFLAVGSPLLAPLSLFLSTQAAVTTVLLLLFVSLTVVGAAVILLAARMIVSRRAGELAMLQARGGSLRQIAATVARGALIAAGPAALAGAALAIAVIPGDSRGAGSRPTGWWLVGFALAAALAGPPLIAAWQHRKPAPARNQARITAAGSGRSRRAWRRPVAEVTAIAASVAGLIVLHDEGVPAPGASGGGINLYLAVTPVLVAIPVVVVMLRVYPLAVRGLLRLSARRAGATGFVALSGAARSSLTEVLPAFGLVLALSLATFAGMLSQGITRGEVAASWQVTGADAVITADPSAGPISPAAVRAIAAVRGVRQATAIWTTTWAAPYGLPLTVVAVDPAGYAALVAGTPFPAFPATLIHASRTAVPVLASPSAAAILGQGATRLTGQAMGPVTVRVAGTLSSTPALPGGGAFVIMPLQTLPGPLGRPAPHVVLVTGSSIDEAQLSRVAGRLIPDSSIVFRAAALASLSDSALQHGATLIITVAIATAAAFGLFIVMFGVALGSGERELTLARLTVMGHEHPTWLVTAEALPAVIAAAAAGAACAVALPRAIGFSINLSAFTETSAPVQFQFDAAALALPAAAIGVLAVAALAGQARVLRRRGVTGVLRIS